MKIYADVPGRRFRQMVTDAAVLVWIVAWSAIGFRIYNLIDELGDPGRTLERAGRRLGATSDALGQDVVDVPLVGETLRAPFDLITDAGRGLAQAGATQQDVVHTVAIWIGVLLAIIPISYVLMRYLPERIRWSREAGAATGLRLDAPNLQLLALRAIATRPLHELCRATPDPGAAYAEGNYAPLAELELRALGLRT